MIGVGSKVVCIRDCDGKEYFGRVGFRRHPNPPKKGEIFVVSDLEVDNSVLFLVFIGDDANSWCASKFAELEHVQAMNELEYLRTHPAPAPHEAKDTL